MKITDAFLGEHAVFYAQFDYLEQNGPKATGNLVKSWGAMLAVALASHAGLEEDLLFTTLEPHIGSMGPLAVMRMEHEAIERSLEKLSTIQGEDGARELLLHTISVARDHFAKEERILYPIANQRISNEKLVDLGSQWSAHRTIFLA